MRELIKTLLADAVRKAAPDFRGEISVKITENKNHGDYTSNVAFALSKIFSPKTDQPKAEKKSPQKIAEYLVDKLERQKIKEFSKIEAENGFINFFLSKDCLHHQLQDILNKKNKYGNSDMVKNRKIQIEFISANPTGPLTIGNGRGGFYGDVLANILKSQGNEVVREYYINDRGGQILALGRSIKLAQGNKLNSIHRTDSPNRLAKPIGFGESDDVNYLPNPDFFGSANLYKGEYINDLAKKIDKKLNAGEAGQKAVELILKNYIKPVIKKIGIKYDVWFSEKSIYQKETYKKVMENLMQKDLVYEKDGATWMKTSQLGDTEDRVLIKSNGDETYFMSDILYHLDKFKTRKFDEVIDVWGADHHGDVPRLMGALKILGLDLERLEIILIQFVRLVSGGKETKVSKRAGTFITLEELAAKVGLDAARFFFLMYSPNTHMDFDMDLAKERSAKNPVYYAQYAHARLSGILKRAKNENYKYNLSAGKLNLKFLKENDVNLIRKIIEFPEILSEISENYEVHRLPRYVLEVAREFHNFYEKERVISENKDLTSVRLALITATKIVLANSLNLMGIKAPDKM